MQLGNVIIRTQAQICLYLYFYSLQFIFILENARGNVIVTRWCELNNVFITYFYFAKFCFKFSIFLDSSHLPCSSIALKTYHFFCFFSPKAHDEIYGFCSYWCTWRDLDFSGSLMCQWEFWVFLIWNSEIFLNNYSVIISHFFDL